MRESVCVCARKRGSGRTERLCQIVSHEFQASGAMRASAETVVLCRSSEEGIGRKWDIAGLDGRLERIRNLGFLGS